MMEYITYAHILNGEVYQIGDFGAVALWYINHDRVLIVGCRQVKTWTIVLQSSKVDFGDYTTNSAMRVENVSSTNSSLFSTTQSTPPPRPNFPITQVLELFHTFCTCR